MSSCGDSTEEASPILALVNGGEITEAELNQTIQRVFGANNANEAIRENILESMVLSKLVYAEAQVKLDEQKLAELERDINNYREQLYIKAYLQQQAPPRPITMEMVREYYENNLERFGGGEVREFEMLSGVKKDETSRNALAEEFSNLKVSADWKQQAENLIKTGHAVRYSRGNSDDKVLHQRLQQALAATPLNEKSASIMIDGIPNIVKVIELKKSTAKPLSEVHQEISTLTHSNAIKRGIGYGF